MQWTRLRRFKMNEMEIRMDERNKVLDEILVMVEQAKRIKSSGFALILITEQIERMKG